MKKVSLRVICSDSESALEALSAIKFHSALSVECWDKITNLTSDNAVKLMWVPVVPVHWVHEGKDKADELAKIATSIVPFTHPRPSPSKNKNLARYCSMDKFCNHTVLPTDVCHQLTQRVTSRILINGDGRKRNN